MNSYCRDEISVYNLKGNYSFCIILFGLFDLVKDGIC